MKKKEPKRNERDMILGSIGDMSARVGMDVRELKMMGYSDGEIMAVANGRLSLRELLRRKPDNDTPVKGV